MRAGAESRKKTIAAGALGAVALICAFYMYSALFGGSTASPPPSVAPVVSSGNNARITQEAGDGAASDVSSARGGAASAGGLGATPGVAAKRLASTSASLDPTLDESAMLRTEHLVYSGSGRNIFSATYTPAALVIPKNMPSARPRHPVYTPPPVPTGPPPPPPINLKFFGTAQRAGGPVQAFLLQGEDVYLASPGDIVARKYKIDRINRGSLTVTDLQNNNTQTLPLQMR